MTREAKIGLLTGLGVIVLIGVLLSEYLGGPTAGTPSATNRMAQLPVASAYRERVVTPAGESGAQRVEGVQVADAGHAASPTGQAGSMTPGIPFMNEIGNLPRAYAADSDPLPMDSSGSAATPVPGHPVMGAPITPIKDGRVLAMAQANPGVPVFQLDDGAPVAMVSLAKGTQTGTGKPVIAGVAYVIAPGDTLAKIARKFYKSAKTEDEQRIVAANPSSLKNVTTMLVAGRKLIIPPAPQAAVAAFPKDDAPKAGTATAMLIHPPGFKPAGAADGKADAKIGDALKKDAGKKDAPTLYVVLDGDTLEKIAKKCSANNYQAFAKQLGALNNIKDPKSLQVGMKLKLPTKA